MESEIGKEVYKATTGIKYDQELNMDDATTKTFVTLLGRTVTDLGDGPAQEVLNKPFNLADSILDNLKVQFNSLKEKLDGIGGESDDDLQQRIRNSVLYENAQGNQKQNVENSLKVLSGQKQFKSLNDLNSILSSDADSELKKALQIFAKIEGDDNSLSQEEYNLLARNWWGSKSPYKSSQGLQRMWNNAGALTARFTRAFNEGEISEGFYASKATFDDFLKTPIGEYDPSDKKWSQMEDKDKLKLWTLLQNTKDVLPKSRDDYFQTDLYKKSNLPYSLYKEFHPRSETYLYRNIFSKNEFNLLEDEVKKEFVAGILETMSNDQNGVEKKDGKITYKNGEKKFWDELMKSEAAKNVYKATTGTEYNTNMTLQDPKYKLFVTLLGRTVRELGAESETSDNEINENLIEDAFNDLMSDQRSNYMSNFVSMEKQQKLGRIFQGLASWASSTLNLKVTNQDGNYVITTSSGQNIQLASKEGSDEFFSQLVDTVQDNVFLGIISPKSVYYSLNAQIMAAALYNSPLNPFEPGQVTEWLNQYLGEYQDTSIPCPPNTLPSSNECIEARTKNTWAKTMLGDLGNKFGEGNGVSKWLQGIISTTGIAAGLLETYGGFVAPMLSASLWGAQTLMTVTAPSFHVYRQMSIVPPLAITSEAEKEWGISNGQYEAKVRKTMVLVDDIIKGMATETQSYANLTAPLNQSVGEKMRDARAFEDKMFGLVFDPFTTLEPNTEDTKKTYYSKLAGDWLAKLSRIPWSRFCKEIARRGDKPFDDVAGIYFGKTASIETNFLGSTPPSDFVKRLQDDLSTINRKLGENRSGFGSNFRIESLTHADWVLLKIYELYGATEIWANFTIELSVNEAAVLKKGFKAAGYSISVAQVDQ